MASGEGEPPRLVCVARDGQMNVLFQDFTGEGRRHPTEYGGGGTSFFFSPFENNRMKSLKGAGKKLERVRF